MQSRRRRRTILDGVIPIGARRVNGIPINHILFQRHEAWVELAAPEPALVLP
jgi:hypothetical protein